MGSGNGFNYLICRIEYFDQSKSIILLAIILEISSRKGDLRRQLAKSWYFKHLISTNVMDLSINRGGSPPNLD